MVPIPACILHTGERAAARKAHRGALLGLLLAPPVVSAQFCPTAVVGAKTTGAASGSRNCKSASSAAPRKQERGGGVENGGA